MGADFMEKAMVGYADIASSPMDALAAMIGEKDVPKVIAQGVLDASAVVLHDSHDEVSNLWGAFGRVCRSLPCLKLHFACKGL